MAEGAEGEPEAYLVFRYFLCCLYMQTRMVPENSINYLFIINIYLCGEISHLQEYLKLYN